MKLVDGLLNIIRGACMAAADSVPGVSGGTIAFIFGFYEKFITSISDFLLGPWTAKKKAFPFLFILGIGWIASFIICTKLISSLFDTHVYELSSLFLGLTLAAIPIVAYEERESLKGQFKWSFFTIIGIAAVALILNIGSFGTVDLSQLTLPIALLVIVSGIIAISVLMLPGISGATVLLIMGMYIPLLTAINGLLRMELTYLPIALLFFAGAVIGFALFSKVVGLCFEKFRPQTLYCVIGLLIGSLYAIAKGPTTLAEPLPGLDFGTFSILFFILGMVIIVGLQIVKHLIARRKNTA